MNGELLLKHVVIKQENGKRIPVTPTEFCRKFDKSKRDRIRLVCELCEEEAHLSSNNGTLYFKHRNNSIDKSCPERSQNRSIPSFEIKKRDIPIRFSYTENEANFALELYSLPQELLQAILGNKFKIQRGEPYSSEKVYDFARFKNSLYLHSPIGHISKDENDFADTPQKKISICLGDSVDKSIYDYWPEEVDGLDFDQDIVFDEFRKKLTKNADIYINRDYYLFSKKERNEFLTAKKRVELSKPLGQYWFYDDKIYLYSFKIKKINKYTEDFVRKNFKCRLSAQPVRLIPLWPPCTRDPYIVRVGKDCENVFFYTKGDGLVTTKTYPPPTITKTWFSDCIVKITNTDFGKRRFKLIAAGRTSVLQYALLWRETLQFPETNTEVKVVDSDDESAEFKSGENSRLPKRRLRIAYRFKGYCEVFQDGRLVDKKELPIPNGEIGETEIIVDKWGTGLKVYQGKDCVYETVFKREKSPEVKPVADLPSDRSLLETRRDARICSSGNFPSDRGLLETLKRQRGQREAVSHSFALIATKMSGYPLTKAWLRNALRQGEAPRAALEILKKTFA